jgi:dipeptidyl aminopeptidase/acylaminoacyl peptidase
VYRLLPGGEANVADARFGITGGQLFVHSDAGGERPALLGVGLNGDAEPSLPYVVAARTSTTSTSWRSTPAGARAALVGTSTGRSEVDLLDLRSGITEPLPGPGRRRHGAAFTATGAALLVGQRGPDGPADDHPDRARRCGPIRPRRGSRRPTQPLRSPPCSRRLRATPGTSSTPSCTTSPAEDGLPFSAGCSGPERLRRSRPTLIWLHGGPEAQERPIFQPLFQALLAEGVAVFAPNVRGSGGYGRTFSQADDLDRRFVAITDVRAAVTSLVEQGLATRRGSGVRPVVRGLPDAGGAGLVPELFRVGVDVCGISDFTTFYEQTEPWIAAAAVTKYGDPQAHAALLRELSPIHSADRITAPLLVVHGRYDTNVPIVEAEQIVEALRDRGASPGFLLFDDEGHEVHSTANRARFVHEVVRWVTAHLLDVGEQTA